ncbi:hypothetical protein RRG08_020985 [Elysia crispata]|uniref:ATP synthase subunit b n=1 Tax=Elysia crispata TaxID=231223 RepID=A0AAE0XYX7_9GAST|nr:hypothetical protein RRG08_020985 [Elysia crispata]
MLSAFRSGALKSVIQGHGAFKVLAVVPSRQGHSISKQERIETWDYVNSVYFGPERDMKNFPNPTQPAKHEPVRLGIVPQSWFDFMYPKTGVTGPYVFGGGLALWMMSKEIMVVDHYFWEIPSFWIMVYILCNHQKVGPQLTKWVAEKYEARKHVQFTRPINMMKDAEKANIAKLDRLIEETETIKHVHQAKKEGVEFQLEAAYRQRLQTAYQEVKKRLDYEVEKANTKRRFEQDHMVNWIVNSVTKSITPQQEKESIQLFQMDYLQLWSCKSIEADLSLGC